MASSVRLVIEPPTARVILERPPLNILDIPMIEELGRAVDEAARRPDLSLLMFQSGVEGAFSAGVDVKDHFPSRVEQMLKAFHAVFLRLHEVDAFTVAAVDGHCLGGGCELVTACDLVFATKQSRFGQPEIDVGCFPPVAAALLGRRIGRSGAVHMLLTGVTLSAADATGAGLVSHVSADHAALERNLVHLTAEIRKKSVPVLRAMKRAFRQGLELPYPKSLAAAEAIYLRDLLPLEDMREGVSAFLEKRAPAWKNR